MQLMHAFGAEISVPVYVRFARISASSLMGFGAPSMYSARVHPSFDCP